MAKGAIKAVIATQYDDTGLKKAQKSVGSFAKGLKSTLAGLGVGLSLGSLFSELEQAGRAAAQDAKSYAVLANTLRNVTQASDGAIASADSYIQKLAMQVGIADDQLRPVLGRLVTATGDLAKSQDLLAIAADLAASKNIDLTTAGNALAKAVGGQTTALFRLAPELKKSGDWMATLKQNTAGAAAIAANADPFQRLTVIFGEMQEKIGAALLPAMQKIANYLASEEFQGAFSQLAEDFANIVTGIEVVAESIGNAIQSINTWLGQFGINFDVMGLVNKLLPVVGAFNTILNILRQLGLVKNETAKGADETSRLIRRRLESLGALGSPDTPTTPKSPTTKLTTENTALTKAVNAAKAAFDEKVKAYQAAVQAAQEVIDSTKEMTASFVGLFKVTPKMGEFETNAVSAFDAIYEKIKSTLADGRILQSAATSLTKYADSTLATLRSYAKQQDVLAGKIDVARTITAGVTGLANITGFLETTTESVTTSVRTIANGIETIITKTADVTKSGGLVDNFQKVVDKTKAFAKNLIDLKKMGLNKNLFAQLVNAGADAGGATAQALVDGGADTITALNDLYKQLDDTATIIAQETTDTLYDVGQQVVTNGFIEGLVSQQDALAAAAEALASSFASAFNTAMANALQVALPAMPVAPAAEAITTRPDPKRSPQRYAAWLAGIGGIDPIRSPQSYAAAQANINVTVNAGLGTNGSSVAQEIVSTLKQYERANGAVWMSA